MNSFKTNRIKGEIDAISERLKRVRQSREITIEQAAKELGINKFYLQALENGQLDKIPAGVYGKNFLREYAQFLNLDDKKLLAFFEKKGANEKQ